MNNLEKLLKEKCSNGVEFKRLEEIVNILDSQRKPITKSDRVSGVYRYYGANGIQDYVEDYIFDGTYILMGEDGSVVTEKGTPVLHWVTGKIWVNNHAHILEQKQNDVLLKYIYYYLQTINIEHLVKGVPPKLNQQNMKNLKIAVPPVEVQEEIINILDKFNFLLEELKLEVSSRQQQYEFYRNKLLTFDESLESLDTLHTHTHTHTHTHGYYLENVKYLSLEEIATFSYGYTDKAKDVGSARFIRITDILDNGCLNDKNAVYVDVNKENEKYLLKRGDLVVARTGATFGKTLYYDNEENAIYASFLIKIKLNNDIILNKYYWHFSKSLKYWQQANMYVSKAGQQQFNTNAIKKIVVPVPSIEKQKEIIAILDKFDKLINDITEGLPAEIKARQQQYDYYRNKLLTFKELKVA